MFQAKKPVFGSNYYPEAWDRNLIDEDIALMQSMGLNCVRIAEFAWSTMEPEEGKFDFSLFREVVDKCRDKGISVIMGTPTACPPRWLTQKHPEIFMITVDGGRLAHGGRRDVCPNNELYLSYCDKIVEAMAKEFSRDENIIGWQIDNEIEPEIHGRGCCCPVCEQKFRSYLSEEFGGDIDKLNREWGNYVFSQNYDSFDQVEKPNPKTWTHPSYLYWWGKFQNKSQLDFIKRQYDILKKYVSVPVGHDSMPIFNLDYNRLSKDMDVMQYNHYDYGENFWRAQFFYDYLRPMKSAPFWATETSCCWNGSAEANFMRPANFNVANVWMPLLAGAELVNYWLWRSHYGGQELMHGACVSSCGRPFHVAGEIKALSRQLSVAGDVIEKSRVVSSRIGIHAAFTAHNMYRFQKVMPGFDYKESLMNDVYRPLLRAHIRPDILTTGKDVSDYKLIFTPFMLNLDEENLGERMLEWVKNGGIWVVGPLTDIRNPSGAKFTDRAMGILEKAADVKIEYTLPKGEQYSLSFDDGKTGDTVSLVYDVFSVGPKAKAAATYADGDFVKGKCAIASSDYGKGKIIILGTLPDAQTLTELAIDSALKAGLNVPFADASPSVVTFSRKGEAGEFFAAVETENASAFAICPFDGENVISGRWYASGERIALNPYDVLIVKKS